MSLTNNKINWERVNAVLEEYPKTCIYKAHGLPYFVHPYASVFMDESVQIAPRWDLPKKVTVSTAITGAMFNKVINPNLPETPEEITKSIREVIEAGCTSVHVHVRDANRYYCPDLNYETFHQILDPIKKDYPHVAFDGCIVPAQEEQWDVMKALVKERFFDICIVNTLASFNGDSIFGKPPQIIIEKTRLALENGLVPCFGVNNVGDIDNADRYLIKSGLVDKPTYWGILAALPGCMPMHSPKAMVEGLMIMINRIKEIDPDAVIQVCGAGRAASFLVTMALMMGCNIRVGMEDTIWKHPHHDDIITSNAEAFLWAKQITELLGFELMTGEEWIRQVRGELRF